MANAIRGMPAGIHTVDLAHSSLVIHRVRMPYGIPRVACCASLNLWTETHGVCGLPLSAYLTSELFMHTPHLFLDLTSRLRG